MVKSSGSLQGAAEGAVTNQNKCSNLKFCSQNSSWQGTGLCCTASAREGPSKSVTEVICDQQHQHFTLNVSAWMAGICLSQRWLAQLQGLCLSWKTRIETLNWEKPLLPEPQIRLWQQKNPSTGFINKLRTTQWIHFFKISLL